MSSIFSKRRDFLKSKRVKRSKKIPLFLILLFDEWHMRDISLTGSDIRANVKK